ncbi:diphthine--ammonia ligase [Ginsengibacter hankyongi]|uniref:Diphthine--ammonia ligase n=1 Tax=Ginsengibacter hankyongi TaxID=2607284 RepID=A0A5J5IMU8_9BACT|nr:diphthine--ammonia ligase [Ginsengibacter hankyongi]KAA9041244.1 diphthine--ammonia ligase [Ginsengibacter hankyongi]
MKQKIIINWSGGKDSALCLYKIMQSQQYDVLCLLTSINEKYQRISMHGVRVDLLNEQAESIGLSLIKMQVPEMPSMETYERLMETVLTGLQQKGASAAAFGDIFLDDLRKYREGRLVLLRLKPVFPLWKIPTGRLVREFIDLGFKTIITCVNEKYLDKSFAGRVIDNDFLKDLPPGVDPCGENGEFHTFVFDGPLFKKPIPFTKGEIVYKKYAAPGTQKDDRVNNVSDTNASASPFDNGFWFCDLLLKQEVQEG